PFWIGNSAAFSQPCKLGVVGGVITPIADNPTGCVALSGSDALGSKAGQIDGPGYKRLDFSLFKAFQITERFSLQFRSAFFNILTRQSRRRAVSKRSRYRLAFIGTILICAMLSAAEETQKQKLDRQYQSAVSDYDAGRYAAAAEQLERLLPYAPGSFEIHELL